MNTRGKSRHLMRDCCHRTSHCVAQFTFTAVSFKSNIMCAWTNFSWTQMKYLGEGPYFSECVGANPMFLAQVVSFLGFLKLSCYHCLYLSEAVMILYHLWGNPFRLRLILYLMKCSFKKAQSVFPSFLHNLCHLNTCWHSIFFISDNIGADSFFVFICSWLHWIVYYFTSHHLATYILIT
jgi:hypothetical protein